MAKLFELKRITCRERIIFTNRFQITHRTSVYTFFGVSAMTLGLQVAPGTKNEFQSITIETVVGMTP